MSDEPVVITMKKLMEMKATWQTVQKTVPVVSEPLTDELFNENIKQIEEIRKLAEGEGNDVNALMLLYVDLNKKIAYCEAYLNNKKINIVNLK